MKYIFETSRKIVQSKYCIGFIFFLILLSAITIGLETYPSILARYQGQLSVIDTTLILFFTLEMVLKVLAEGKKPLNFFKDPWNIFDFLIVAICLVPLGDTHYYAVLRILRVLRIFRMITIFPKLKLIVSALLKSIPSMGYVMMLIGLLFYVYAVVGVFLFGKADPLHFRDLHHAFLTLFSVLTLEGWTDIMNVHILGQSEKGIPQIINLWPFFYFSSFIIIGAMIIMNLFIGVIMNSMEESQKEMEAETNRSLYKQGSNDMLYMQLLKSIEELKAEIKSLKG